MPDLPLHASNLLPMEGTVPERQKSRSMSVGEIVDLAIELFGLSAVNAEVQKRRRNPAASRERRPLSLNHSAYKFVELMRIWHPDKTVKEICETRLEVGHYSRTVDRDHPKAGKSKWVANNPRTLKRIYDDAIKLRKQRPELFSAVDRCLDSMARLNGVKRSRPKRGAPRKK